MRCLNKTEIGLFLLASVLLLFLFHWLTSRENDNLKADQFTIVNHHGKDAFHVDGVNSACAEGRACTKQRNVFEGFAYVRSVGGNAYKIHEDLENPQLAANTMDQLNTSATTFIDALTAKYIKDTAGLSHIKHHYRHIVRKGIVALKKNFKTANLEENLPARSGGDTSYVIDKGAVFALCLRDPKNNNAVESKMNNLMFVLIHELAHLFTSTFGHDELFWNNFKFLLQEAVELGLYKAVDYKKTGSPYCGIVVTYSPLFDASLKEYKNDRL
jgi:hypothetical protein